MDDEPFVWLAFLVISDCETAYDLHQMRKRLAIEAGKEDEAGWRVSWCDLAEVVNAWHQQRAVIFETEHKEQLNEDSLPLPYIRPPSRVA